MKKTLVVLITFFSFTLTFCQGETETLTVDSKKAVFIHHSTGGRLIADNWGTLGSALDDAGYFLSDICYQWDATLNDDIGSDTDIGHWWIWFMDKTVQSNGTARNDNIMKSVYLKSTKDDYSISRYGDYTRTVADPGGENEIIIFKSCYPNNDILADNATKPENIFGTYAGHTSYTETNVRVVYDTILNYFKASPDKLFIVLTAPPNRETSNGDRARSFNNWLINNWLQEANWHNKNVYVYDYYNVLTDLDNHHWVVNGEVVHFTNPGSSNNSGAYLTLPADNYPNMEGQQKVAAEFVPVLNIWYQTWKGTTSFESSVVNRKEVLVYPNPSNGIFELHIEEESGKFNFDLISFMGQFIEQSTVEIGESPVRMSLEHLKSGVYLFRLYNRDVLYYGKLVIDD